MSEPMGREQVFEEEKSNREIWKMRNGFDLGKMLILLEIFQFCSECKLQTCLPFWGVEKNSIWLMALIVKSC